MDRLTGKQFEEKLVRTHTAYRDLGLASIGRYGVQASYTSDGLVAIQSLPDFEGITRKRDAVIFDAKVCSQASFALNKYANIPGRPTTKRRQITHMYERASYGVDCFFLIHWNERVMKTKTIPTQTWVFPVAQDLPFWKAFEASEVKSINLEHCKEHGTPVEWETIGNGRTPRPNWLGSMEVMYA